LADETNAKPWPILRSFAGWRPASLGADALAGLTLAAIAIPEQMATARLGGLAPETGFLALIAGAVGFAIFGASRLMSVGADSTIAPIFAGAIAALAASGTADYAQDAAALALCVGLVLCFAGLFRFGFIADLLSIPVTTGFLAGIAVHILASQAPALIGVDLPAATTVKRLVAVAEALPRVNPWTLLIGLGVYAAMEIGERLSPRTPSALIAVAAATLATVGFGLEARGVATLGVLPALSPHFSLPMIRFAAFREIAPLALIVAVVVMVQTAATSRSFVSDPARGPDINSDFLGVAAANLLAGFTGAFPVNGSPPRTAVVSATGGVSQIGSLFAAALALVVALYGGQALAGVPHAALAGVLLFVARRILRTRVIVDVLRRSLAEAGLIAATLIAIVALPIEQGVGVGIMISILHGVWTTTRARVVEFERIPGTSIWWPRTATSGGELVAGVKVVGLQAPLSFLNAYQFQQALQGFAHENVKLLVIEATAIVEIDYTGAKILGDAIENLRDWGVDVAFARLESVRAQQSFAQQGLEALVGTDRLFHSVEEAVGALGPPSAR